VVVAPGRDLVDVLLLDVVGAAGLKKPVGPVLADEVDDLGAARARRAAVGRRRRAPPSGALTWRV